MRALIPTARYTKDIKRIGKRGWNLERLRIILEILAHERLLPPATRPHKLSGEWEGFWECHVAADWLLLYKTTVVTVILARTGDHADLFGE